MSMDKGTELREYDGKEGFKKAPSVHRIMDSFEDDDDDDPFKDKSDSGQSKLLEEILKFDTNNTKPLKEDKEIPPPLPPKKVQDTTHTNGKSTTPEIVKQTVSITSTPLNGTSTPLNGTSNPLNGADVPPPKEPTSTTSSSPDSTTPSPASSATPSPAPSATSSPNPLTQQSPASTHTPKVTMSHIASPQALRRSSNNLNASSDSDNESKVLSYNERLKMYEDVLQSDILEINVLRTLAWQGIPESRGLRAKYWKILLHYLPANKTLWDTSLSKSRKTYQDWLQELVIDPHAQAKEAKAASDHPLSLEQDSKWHAFFKDNEISAEIEKDVKRTFPHLHFFNQISPTGQEIASPHYHTLKRILFIYAKLNPGIRYVQGMNEILGPIYYTFATDTDTAFRDHAEADAFFCFTNLMSEVMDNFCKTLDKSEMGIVGNMKRLNNLLKVQDNELWSDLEDKKMNPQFYSFRWITLLLSQEFELPDVLRLWDSLFADPQRFDFFYCFCCAMLLCVRDKILDGSFADNLKLLQSYPPIDFQIIFGVAMQVFENTYTAPPPRKKTEAPQEENNHHSHSHPHSHHHQSATNTQKNPTTAASKLSIPTILNKLSPVTSPIIRHRGGSNADKSDKPLQSKTEKPAKIEKSEKTEKSKLNLNLPLGLGKFQL